MNTTITRPQPRRRSRLLGVVAGVLAAVALLPAGANAAQTSETSAWLQYQPPTGTQPFLFGGFTTEKRVCEKRTVSIYKSTDLMNWDYVWHTEDVSGPNPGLTKYLSNADRNHYYVLSAHKSTVRKNNGKKVNCAPAQSEAIWAN
jgi:hypothetical protein